ncbi:MAG: hypothetical protein V4550_07745 [Gemmatimonadota bacterium]
MKRFFEHARRLAWLAAGLLGAKLVLGISVPLPDATVLSKYFDGSAGLLGLYNLIVGGALAKGSAVALGLMPYLSARSFVFLARAAGIRTKSANRVSDKWLTRGLTVSFAIVQAIGYARLTQTLPGVVSEPGALYMAQMVVMLTSVSTLLMLFAEEATSAGEDEKHEPPLLGEAAAEHRSARRERDPLYVSHPTPAP